MLLLKLDIFLDQGVDPVNHALDQLHLGVSQAMFVGDVVGDSSLTSGLSSGASRLNLELLASLLQTWQTFLGVTWQINMNRGSHPGAQVGGAGVDVAILGVQHELLPRLLLDTVTHSSDATSQTIKHSLHISTLLHGDDPQLVLLVDPHQEGLLLVVEDPSALGPVPLHAGGLEVLVPGHEEEVIVHQLLSDGLLLQGEQELVRSETEVSGGLTMPVRG